MFRVTELSPAFAGARFSYTFLRHGLLPLPRHFLVALQENPKHRLLYQILAEGLLQSLHHSGPLFVKFGQIMAMREDLLPKEICLKLENLFDQQQPMSVRRVREQIRAGLGEKADLIVNIDNRPLGVGSIGQVHRAQLRSKESVIVKVRRPRVADKIVQDRELLLFLTGVLERFAGPNLLPTIKTIRRMIYDLAEGVTLETDFLREKRALEKIAWQVRRRRKIAVPKVYAEQCSDSVLVMEELRGVSLAKFLRKKGVARAKKTVAEKAVKEVLQQIFIDGFFHADPHGGNFIVMQDGRIGLIDLGLTGEFSDEYRRNINTAIRALLKNDAEAAFRALLQFGELPDGFDYAGFKAAVRRVFLKHKAAQAKRKSRASSRVKLDSLVNELFREAYQFDIHVPKNVTLLIKTFVTLEGLAKSLDKDSSLVKLAAPVVLQSWLPRFLR